MKIILTALRLLCLLILIMILSPGCLKDKSTYTYRIYTPVYKTKAEVRANIKSNASQQMANPGKIFTRGNYIFLNEIDKGVHIIDNSIPSAPKNLAFIDIPGNSDLAVKGNILYGDLYTDLVAIDISDPLHVVLKNVVANAFPERFYANGFIPDTSKIITEWLWRDTTVNQDLDNGNQPYGCANCGISFLLSSVSSSMAPSTKSTVGVGGSMARFSIVNNSLYTVNSNSIKVYSIATPEAPLSVNNVSIGNGIETIYPFKDKLFIGSNSGVFIYDITNESNPTKLGQFSHLTSCDPVIADGNNAFVTLSSGVRCSTGSNELDVLDISSLSSPTLVKSYPMTGPHGLSKDGNNLFICDGVDGLKIYDASVITDLKLKNHFTGFESYDVIANNNLAIVVTKKGILQYDYSNVNNIKLLSTIGWE